jgi:hypothetical protein
MRRLIRGKWASIEEPTGYSGAAIYAVRLVARGRVIHIRRFLETDPEGILTIGMTKHLEQRRRRFIAGYTRGRGHSAANLLLPLLRSRKFRTMFQSVTFELAFRPAVDASLALDRETRLTHEYWKRYGEAPPLTSVFAARYAHLQDG